MPQKSQETRRVLLSLDYLLNLFVLKQLALSMIEIQAPCHFPRLKKIPLSLLIVEEVSTLISHVSHFIRYFLPLTCLGISYLIGVSLIHIYLCYRRKRSAGKGVFGIQWFYKRIEWRRPERDRLLDVSIILKKKISSFILHSRSNILLSIRNHTGNTEISSRYILTKN